MPGGWNWWRFVAVAIRSSVSIGVRGNRDIGQRSLARSVRKAVENRFEAAEIVGEGKSSDSLRLTAINKVAGEGAAIQLDSFSHREKTISSVISERLASPAEDVISYTGR